jgi:prepilin-type N-terminal cleavage/methylation domain-containing protein
VLLASDAIFFGRKIMKANRMNGLKGQMQKGFTLVELAIVLVIAGLILVAVLKGTDAINKAKVERAVADLKGLQGMLLETQKRVNRLPGDCDNDGTIELYPVATRTYLSSGQVPAVENSNRDVALNGICGTPGATTGVDDMLASQTVPATGAGALADTANLVYNEMRRDGVVDGHRTNLELAKHTNQDVFLVGSMQDAANPNTRANVIVMYGIPVWLAEAIDAEIDGVSQDYAGLGPNAGPACNGRVRRWDNTATVVAITYALFSCNAGFGQYNQGGLTRDDLVSISFQFDTIKLDN